MANILLYWIIPKTSSKNEENSQTYEHFHQGIIQIVFKSDI